MCTLLQKAGVLNTCLLPLLSAPKTVHVPMCATSSKPPLLLSAYRFAISLSRSGDFSSPHKICDFVGAPKRTNSSLNFTKFQLNQFCQIILERKDNSSTYVRLRFAAVNSDSFFVEFSVTSILAKSNSDFTKFQPYQCMRREHGCISIACTKAFAPYIIRRRSRHHNFSIFNLQYSLN